MKKMLLITSVILLTCEISNCQWYQRKFGVNDINLLSTEQINLALVNCKTGLVFGAVFAIPATIGIIGGLIMLTSDHPEPTAKDFEGFAYLVLSLPPEILGLTLLGVYSSRLKSIKEVLKNTEIKIGVINYPPERLFPFSERVIMPGISIKFRF